MPHKELAEFKKLGLTPQEIADLVAQKQDAPGQLDKIMAQHEAAAALKISALESDLAACRIVERDALVPALLATALCHAGATPGLIDLLTSYLAERVVFTAAGGKRTVQILQADKKTPMAGSGRDGAATFRDLTTEVASAFPSMFTP